MNRLQMFETGLLWSLQGLLLFWPITFALVAFVALSWMYCAEGEPVKRVRSWLWLTTPSLLTIAMLLIGVFFIKGSAVYPVDEQIISYVMDGLFFGCIPLTIGLILEFPGYRPFVGAVCLLQWLHCFSALQIVASAVSGVWP